MAKNIEDIMTYEPADALVFEGPFDKYVKRQLVIRSLSDKDMVYKIKTTSPRLFYVRPNIGLLTAKSTVNIEIYMQPKLSTVPSSLAKHHKFLIVAGEATEDVEDFHGFFKQLDPANTWEGRVRCFLVHRQPEVIDTLVNELAEPIRQTAGGVDEVEVMNDALQGDELEDLNMTKEKVTPLEEEIKDIRGTTENVEKAKENRCANRSSKLFMFVASLVTVGAVILITHSGEYAIQRIKQVF
ncbi:vesicle-associated membrane protein-associated protein B [Drosophila guanche]|uniref:Blast:Vesicle-associated membrane protein-associated protein B n=1 Tax=Drosophila guanche TaxID=7266 RepID=A0A3B0KFQ2_DROGU|nr:vesicle-associated membrane protein-associated protein B [Drosophila guanche]SPP87190.1 blast:Vesicle-associated membrane protein-associated protein B [Drosophila guanche]